MTPTRTIVVEALHLAARRGGVQAAELAEAAGCSERTARRQLGALVADGVLAVERPTRAGRARGDWRNRYIFLKGGAH